MTWAMIQVALGFAGVAVLGVLAVRVAVEVHRLACAVADGTRRLGEAAEELERAAAAVSARGGRIVRTARGSGAERE